ncbi:MAG: ferrous iron transport protein A [Caldisphaeraceae archaeon]|nr:ferrous iron transport protein A [Caldisphaeraceae archaeon]
MQTLAEVEEGKSVRIVEIMGGYGLISRLLRLGIIKGVVVSVVRNRGPVVLRFGDSVFAIGRGMAMKILVEEVVRVEQ